MTKSLTPKVILPTPEDNLNMDRSNLSESLDCCSTFRRFPVIHEAARDDMMTRYDNDENVNESFAFITGILFLICMRIWMIVRLYRSRRNFVRAFKAFVDTHPTDPIIHIHDDHHSNDQITFENINPSIHSHGDGDSVDNDN